MNVDQLDGRIGEGWGGTSPNGAHLNVVLARRGSPTAAAAIGPTEVRTPATRPVWTIAPSAETPVRTSTPARSSSAASAAMMRTVSTR